MSGLLLMAGGGKYMVVNEVMVTTSHVYVLYVYVLSFVSSSYSVRFEQKVTKCFLIFASFLLTDKVGHLLSTR